MLPLFYCPARKLLTLRFIQSTYNVPNYILNSSRSLANDIGHPNNEQLQHVHDVLAKDVPNYLTRSFNPSIYSQDIIFEDNIRGIRLQGRSNYLIHFAYLRCKTAILFAHLRLDVLKMTQHPEEGTIKVRWQVKALSGAMMVKNLFRLNILKLLLSRQDAFSKAQGIKYYDGFSIFYVNGQGLVYKHLCEKMMPDEERSREKLVPKLAKKVTGVGVVPMSKQ